MHIKITVEVWELYTEAAEAILTLNGEQVQSVQLGQWIEQTKSRLCKEVAQRLEKKDECCES